MLEKDIENINLKKFLELIENYIDTSFEEIANNEITIQYYNENYESSLDMRFENVTQ